MSALCGIGTPNQTVLLPQAEYLADCWESAKLAELVTPKLEEVVWLTCWHIFKNLEFLTEFCFLCKRTYMFGKFLESNFEIHTVVILLKRSCIIALIIEKSLSSTVLHAHVKIGAHSLVFVYVFKPKRMLSVIWYSLLIWITAFLISHNYL